MRTLVSTLLEAQQHLIRALNEVDTDGASPGLLSPWQISKGRQVAHQFGDLCEFAVMDDGRCTLIAGSTPLNRDDLESAKQYMMRIEGAVLMADHILVPTKVVNDALDATNDIDHAALDKLGNYV
jgi:hypothetical protein